MNAADVRRAMRVLPAAMATMALLPMTWIALMVIQERIAVWLAVGLAAVFMVWLAAVTIRVRRRHRMRLDELRDPITGSLSAGEVGTPLPWRARLWLAGTPALAAVVLVMSASLPGAGNTCVSRGIATAAAREGICKRGLNLFGGGRTYNVVDAGHVLHMPGLDVQLLATSARPTTVSNASVSPNFYPDGTGMLVCLEVAITNRGTAPLTYDAAGSDIALLLQDPATKDLTYYFPDEPNLAGEPQPSLAAAGPLRPEQTQAGWVAFVAPQWAMKTLNAPSTHLDFSLPHSQGVHSATYLGQIRLWRAANAQGARAVANNLAG